jgi:hypothetical protein
MTTANAKQGYGLVGRAVAIGIAVLLTVLGTHIWQRIEAENLAKPVSAQALVDLQMSADTQNCIAARSGELQKQFDAQLLDQDAFDLSMARARSLCIKQP